MWRNIAVVTFDTKKIPRNCRKRQEKLRIYSDLEQEFS